jgi:hypothetical protein
MKKKGNVDLINDVIETHIKGRQVCPPHVINDEICFSFSFALTIQITITGYIQYIYDVYSARSPPIMFAGPY